jgi:hypothetical protein
MGLRFDCSRLESEEGGKMGFYGLAGDAEDVSSGHINPAMPAASQ